MAVWTTATMTTPTPEWPGLALLAETGSVDIASVVIWSVVLIALLVAGLVFATKLKRKIQADDAAAPVTAAGFTLSDLRAMHRAGQLTDAEFEKAKEKVVLAAQKAAERAKAAVASGEPEPRDSVDAIRARRLARDVEGQNDEGEPGDGRDARGTPPG